MLISECGKLQGRIFALFILFIAGSYCCADTFTNLRTGDILHGYSTLLTKDGKTSVHTVEKGFVELNLADWTIVGNRLGRNDKVIIITIEDPIMYEIETAAFERAITEAVHEGPLFILLQINTPGGRTDYAQRICGAISSTGNCPVVAFVRPGRYGGAISAGAAVALACSRVYMAGETTIGAAATITISKTGQPEALADVYGKEIAEKFNSAWRTYLASLAERNRRPDVLAKAMVDRDSEVVEVLDAGKRLFIDPADKRPDQQVVRVWNKKGSLLTLTAKEAVDCNIADRLADSQEDILRDLDAADAKIITDENVRNAQIELKRANGQLNRILKALDLKIKEAKGPMPPQKSLSAMRDARSDFQTLVRLAKKYPDLQLDAKSLEEELNSIEANYQKVRMDSSQKPVPQ